MARSRIFGRPFQKLLGSSLRHCGGAGAPGQAAGCWCTAASVGVIARCSRWLGFLMMERRRWSLLHAFRWLKERRACAHALPQTLAFFGNSLTMRNCCLANGSPHWMTSVSERYLG
ncbi:hypothetical protein PO909_011602 [Leuciscus waleckii]